MLGNFIWKHNRSFNLFVFFFMSFCKILIIFFISILYILINLIPRSSALLPFQHYFIYYLFSALLSFTIIVSGSLHYSSGLFRIYKKSMAFKIFIVQVRASLVVKW